MNSCTGIGHRHEPGCAPADGATPASAGVNPGSWEDHWRRYSGTVPPIIAALADMNPIAAAAYTGLRAWLFEDHADGLTRGQKELIFTIIDVFANHPEGARLHVRAGLASGLPLMQVREALTEVIMVAGTSPFAEVGAGIWEECQRFGRTPPRDHPDLWLPDYDFLADGQKESRRR
jgi:hypothetical protein